MLHCKIGNVLRRTTIGVTNKLYDLLPLNRRLGQQEDKNGIQNSCVECDLLCPRQEPFILRLMMLWLGHLLRCCNE